MAENLGGVDNLSPEVQRLLNQVFIQNKLLAEKSLKQRDTLRKAAIKAEVSKHKVLFSFFYRNGS